MEQTKGLWRGKPLEEYTKEELIEIVCEMGRMRNGEREQHQRDMDLVAAVSTR